MPPRPDPSPAEALPAREIRLHCGQVPAELDGVVVGERQRLMLARALLRNPALLVLDEATSALDSNNEALVSEALARLRGRMTMVIICHRGALVALADRVVRLENGRVTAIESSVTAA